MKYAKTNEDAYQVGIIALRDKAKTVRHQACLLLSAAQKKDAIEHLEELLSDEASRDDAVAAIDVLLNVNHT
jgi:HEAT repeat protein